MGKLTGKKILFLGATIYFYDAAKFAIEQGAYVIAIDYYPADKAVTKKIVQESYDIDITDINKVCQLAKEKKIDGVYAGASEVSIPIAIEIGKRLDIPFYCSKEQWAVCTNKRKFKELCEKHNLCVTDTYHLRDVQEKLESITYPVVTKPVDNNGSTGITICFDENDLKNGIEKAFDNSHCKDILIETFMDCDSVIVHYTAQNGEIIFSGMSDKKSKKIKADGAPVMALQLFPSEVQSLYLKHENEKVIGMLKDMGVKNGPIWIEVFVTSDRKFVFNEIGYRYGGSLTYYAVEYLYNINQMEMLLNLSVGNNVLYNDFLKKEQRDTESLYAIIPIHVKPGKIVSVEGIDEVCARTDVYKLVQSHVAGDEISNTGTVSQVFGYLHIVGKDRNSIKDSMLQIMSRLRVWDLNKQNMLYTLYEEDMLN